jgi:hypothetical protein
MTARTKNISQYVLTKHANENTKCISTSVDKTHPMPARIQDVSQLVLTEPTHASKETLCSTTCGVQTPPLIKDTKCIASCEDQTTTMPAMTQYKSELVLTNPLPCLRRNEMYLNLCLTNPSHASHDTKCISTCCEQSPQNASDDTICISTCVDQTRPMLERELNISQHVLTRPILSQRGHKMYLNVC